MLDIVSQAVFEVLGYGTGEVVLRCLPRTWVRTDRTQNSKWSRKLIRSKRKKSGKYKYSEHAERIEEIKSQSTYINASDGALVLGADAVTLLGLLVWLFIVIILTIACYFWAVG
jgi:hypothetical protein